MPLVDTPPHLRSPGRLVKLRGREWVVLPSADPDLLLIKPLGGSDQETTGIFLPLAFEEDRPTEAEFPNPTADELGAFSSARLLLDSARLSFRNGAGPFRCLAKLSFRPRAYQMVPLIMALRQELVRLLVADDVGVGKTIEALLIIRELLERRVVERFAVICLPHLCDQWQEEIRSKIGVEAVVIRSNTQARLDREIHGDASVFQFFPFQVLSIDYIKSPARRDVFVSQCPELVVVDEAHSCTLTEGANPGQQQRYDLVRRIAEKKNQHLVLLTATPHSGKSDQFRSLLGLLHREFGMLDVPAATQEQRRRLAGHFIQRRRGDVLKWLGEDTKFAQRDPGEVSYDLSPSYGATFDRILDFARTLVTGRSGSDREQRVHYWTALGLLRGVMSSPAAGVEMLRNRLNSLSEDAPSGESDDDAGALIHDANDGFLGDFTPGEVLESGRWNDQQKRQFTDFARELDALRGAKHDAKLAAAGTTLTRWLNEGFSPVVFCRFLATAKYLGEQLPALLPAKLKDVRIEVVTSEDPDDIRRARVAELGKATRRILIATDCLSEGINLQEAFTAVLHYDLPWNPNRLEQREGRVDRFGQTADVVKTYLLFGRDNPIDGIVLGIILNKVREIRRVTGITIPFPEESRGVIDAVAKALLLNPDRRVSVSSDKQLSLGLESFPEAQEAEARISHELRRAEDREKATRSIFAQHAIKADEVEKDLREADEAIGDVTAVEEFVRRSLRDLFEVQVDATKQGWRVYRQNLPPALAAHLPEEPTIDVSFHSPTPRGLIYLGRNHPFVEQLCQVVMARTLERQIPGAAARASVIRTKAVKEKTTLLLFRCRNVIGEKNAPARIVAEEMLVWGYHASPDDGRLVEGVDAHRLLETATPTTPMSPQSQANFLKHDLDLLPTLRTHFDKVAESRSKHLVEAHERFSRFFRTGKFEVIYPVLPMDVLGIYVLLPDSANGAAP